MRPRLLSSLGARTVFKSAIDTVVDVAEALASTALLASSVDIPLVPLISPVATIVVAFPAIAVAVLAPPSS